MSIGLYKGTVTVEPHNVEWERSAQEVIDKLKNILKEVILDVQHIGSTSVKNVCAKPIVDIVVGVSSFDRIRKYNDILMTEGIIYRGEDHPEQLLYICGKLENNLHTHYIHVVIWGQKRWTDYINMRDYLNSHEKGAREYSELKERLAIEYSADRVSYTNSKSTFIEEILKKAEEWRKQ